MKYFFILLNLTALKFSDNPIELKSSIFSAEINLDFDNNRSFHAVFIRAPRVSRIGKYIKILASYNGEPVLLRNGMHLASSFHPEIGDDLRIHEYFINK